MGITYETNAIFPFESYQTATFDQEGYEELTSVAPSTETQMLYEPSVMGQRDHVTVQQGGPLPSSSCTSFNVMESVSVANKKHRILQLDIKVTERDLIGTNLWDGFQFSVLGKAVKKIESVKLEETDYNQDGNLDYVYSIWQSGQVISGYVLISTPGEHKLLWTNGDCAAFLTR